MYKTTGEIEREYVSGVCSSKWEYVLDEFSLVVVVVVVVVVVAVA